MTSERGTTPRWIGPILGLVTAGVALGVAHLVAGWVGAATSPVIAVGEAAIDLSPPGLKSFAIRSFGSNDKQVLLAGIGVVLVLAALDHRRRRRATAPQRLDRARRARRHRRAGGAHAPGGDRRSTSCRLPPGRSPVRSPSASCFVPPGRQPAPTEEPDVPAPRDLDRRRFLWTAGMGAIVAIGAGAAGSFLARRFRADESRASVRIPAPSSPAVDPTPETLDGVGGISAFFTPNNKFYRVDTALLTPAVTAEDWQLHIHGMVAHERTLTYADVIAMPLIERDITLACVSNPVGGHYIGNARWIGAPLAPILRDAGVADGSDQLVARSADGFTVGTPTAALLDGRDAMLAVAMNGEPLPIAHGFPVRVVVPGLYGYVSATKWVVDMELTTFGAYDAYWIQRGWSQQAPIKVESRIDVPQRGSISAGPRDIAGVAWAQHRGIARVEVQIDGGPWQRAELAPEDTVDTWRQWRLTWDAPAGDHQIAVRATTDDGETQTSMLADPAPNGATGYHTVVVQVS